MITAALVSELEPIVFMSKTSSGYTEPNRIRLAGLPALPSPEFREVNSTNL